MDQRDIWHIDPNDPTEIRDGTGKLVATVYDRIGPEYTAKKTARLLVSSRDLLEAVQNANEALSDVLIWQEGHNQPRHLEPSWIRACRVALHKNSAAIAMAVL